MNIVKDLREKIGMSQKELAIIINVSQPTVSEWEHQKKDPSGERLEKLANLFRVSKAVILCYETLNDKVQENRGESKYVTVPVLGTIPAGVPFEAIEDVIDYEDLPLSRFSSSYKYFGLLVKGDSMEPDYLNKDIIILRKQEDCQSGDDCAVMVNGNDATFKRVRLHENGMTLQPLNPDYSPTFYSDKEIRNLPVRIIGVVVEVRRRIKKS